MIRSYMFTYDNCVTPRTHLIAIEDLKLLDTGLPKWPACQVIGEPVTPEQAAEIIFRTDCAFPDCRFRTNAREKESSYAAVFAIPDMDEVEAPDKGTHPVHYCFAQIEKLRGRLGCIELEYMSNACIMSAYIGGPGGWIDWEGDIRYNNRNIGKWPDVRSVIDEWARIAKAFPYLDLKSQLFDAEYCEDCQPVVEFHIRNGKVTVVNPGEPLLAMRAVAQRGATDWAALGNPELREFGISLEGFKQKLAQVYGSELPTFYTV